MAVIVVITGLFILLFWGDSTGTPITEETWVRVMNLNGIENLDNKFEFGDLGQAREGGKIKIIFEYGNQVLVRYILLTRAAVNNEVPEGTIFWLSRKQYNKIIQKK